MNDEGAAAAHAEQCGEEEKKADGHVAEEAVLQKGKRQSVSEREREQRKKGGGGHLSVSERESREKRVNGRGEKKGGNGCWRRDKE